MHLLPKSLILLALLACAGCAKPSDVTDAGVARRDHILAGPHGWIDLTLHAPATASAPKEAASAARPTADCQVAFTVGGEPMIEPSGDLAQADAAKSPLGYRFVVPAGRLDTRLTIAACVKIPVDLPLSLAIEKGHLTLLEFDGRALKVGATQAWEPTTLEDVNADVAKLHEHGAATDDALATLKALAIAGVLLNVVLLLGGAVLMFRRRRHRAPHP
jgi:hypothetical protein